MAKRNNEYEFRLILDGPEDIDDDMIGRLLAAGCDDGLFGRSNGEIFAAFSREASSFEDAVISAIKDINRADIGVTGFRIDNRDLVTQTDIARRIGKTKQAVSRYVNGRNKVKGFPAPAVASKDPLYQWADVAEWLQKANLLDGDAAKTAEERHAVQTALEFGRVARKYPEVVRKFGEMLNLPKVEVR